MHLPGRARRLCNQGKGTIFAPAGAYENHGLTSSGPIPPGSHRLQNRLGTYRYWGKRTTARGPKAAILSRSALEARIPAFPIRLSLGMMVRPRVPLLRAVDSVEGDRSQPLGKSVNAVDLRLRY